MYTQNYAVETLPKWWSVGHTDEWAYKTQEEEPEVYWSSKALDDLDEINKNKNDGEGKD